MIYDEYQFEIIKKASPHFETARRDYIRNAPRWLTEEIVSTYETATGKKVLSKDYGCAVCVLHIYQQIGKTYFADLKEREELKSEIQIDTKDDGTGSESKKRNAKSKTGNKKKKE